MEMALNDIRDWIQTALQDVEVDDSTADLYFFTGNDAKFPFATIVTHDDDHDSSSQLNREGIYRLNFPTDKETFQSLFPGIRGKADLQKASFNHQASDAFFPHPIYGAMRWVSVVNPDFVWPECKTLLARAREIRELRPTSW
ncbi:hypothetical protein SAMN05216570_2420 [Dyella sp. OK004]|uniref:DUF6194 family protein n=1 Tax=Dyella sp. OK004 TaxID=1855292 RepID=UPI0008EADF8E|nr:DUF6194 family protein [Dyella sp. OK004]SFS08536.1 hypothetical protein SAMN05216570_2420 [Dyella sp. OK004]